MPNEPQITSLSFKRRKTLFLLLVFVFLVSLPMMIFYTTGYRLNFNNDESTIVTTGGVYITTDNLEVDVYLDGEQVEKPRLFRSAYYIQNIDAGKHKIVVQRPDLHTWTKDLPVDPYIVIEAVAFNVPVLPQIRPITEYVTPDELPVFTGLASTTNLFTKATSTSLVYATTTTATSTYLVNEEYVYVQSLFDIVSSTPKSVFDKFLDGMERFRFATTTVATATDGLEESVTEGGMELVEKEKSVFAVWNDEVENIPYYFCVTNDTASSTSQRYGQHVSDAIYPDGSNATSSVVLDGDRICRKEIKLNHLGQDIYFYDFLPNNSDLVILQLEDGLYVTEIDDRAWQNTQILYPGIDFKVLVENGQIYIYEDDLFFEIVTEIEPN